MKKNCPDTKNPEIKESIYQLNKITKNSNLIDAIFMKNNNQPLNRTNTGVESFQYKELVKALNGSDGNATYIRAKVLSEFGKKHLEHAITRRDKGDKIGGWLDKNDELTISYIRDYMGLFQEFKSFGDKSSIMYYDIPEMSETKEEYISLFEEDIKYLVKNKFISSKRHPLIEGNKNSLKTFLLSTNEASRRENEILPYKGKQSIINNNKIRVQSHFNKMNMMVGSKDAFKLIPVTFGNTGLTNYYLDIDYTLVSKAFTDRQLDMNDKGTPPQKSKAIPLTDTREQESLEKTAKKINILTTSFPGTEVQIDGDLPDTTFGELEYVDGQPVVRINPRTVQSDTVIHEFGHLFIDLLGGMSNPFIKRGRELLNGTDIESNVTAGYSELTPEGLDREILATAIGIEGAKLESQSPFRRWITIFFNKLKLAIGLNGNVALDLAQRMLNNDVNSLLKNTDAVMPTYKQLSKASNSSDTTSLQDKKLAAVTAKIIDRVQILKSKYKKSKKSEFKKDIEKLLEDLMKAKDAKGLVRYIDEIESLSDQVLERIKKIKLNNIDGQSLKNLATFSGIFDMANDIDGLLALAESESEDSIEAYLNEGHITVNENGGYTITPGIDDTIKTSIETELNIILTLSSKKASLDKSISNISSINKRYNTLSQEFLVDQMATSNQATTKVRNKYKERFIKQFNDNLGGRAKAISSYPSKKEYTIARDMYVTEQLANAQDEIAKDTKNHLRKILATVPRDINDLASWLSDPKNLDSSLIGFVTKILEEADFKATRTLTDEEKTAEVIFDEYSKYKGSTSNMEEFYSELLEKDNKGNLTGYLVGEYLSSSKDYSPTMNSQYDRIRTLKRTEPNHPLVKMYDYLTDLSRRRDVNLPESYKLGKEFMAGTNADGVITAYTYKLPSIEKGPFERISEQGFGTFFVEGLKDLYAKDTSYTESGESIVDDKNNLESSKFKVKRILVDESGNARQDIPIHFRANIKDAGQQSYDLMGITLADYHMSANYKEKSIVRHIAEIALDVATNSRVVQMSGDKYQVNALSKTQANVTKLGTQSNMFKVLNSIVQHRLYGISSIDMGDVEIKGKDVSINKLANNVMKWTADTMLIGNVMAGGVNLSQGTIYNFMEGLSSGFYNLSDIIKANKLYWSDMKDIVDDASGKRIPSSMTNLFIQQFNAFAEIEDIGKKFTHTNRITQLTNGNSLHFISNTTEHYIQATVMYAVLNTIKVKNTKGEEVSIMDAYEKKGNKLVVKDGFNVDINTEAKISSRIKEVTKQIHGNYDSQNLAMIQRYVGGKFVFMLRKWLVVGVQRRWRGISTARTNKENLDDNDIFYSEILEQDVEGYYISAVRFLNTVKFDLFKLRLNLVSNNWHELTDAERSNIRKTIMEATLIVLTLIASKLLAGLAKDADDEDKEFYYRLAYLFRRLHSESFFYINPNETLKILSTPAASISMLQNVSKVFNQLGDPLEEYKIGPKKGQSKLKRKVYKVIPIASQLDKDIKEIYEWLEKEG